MSDEEKQPFTIGDRVELKPTPKGRGKIYDDLIEAVKAKKVAGAYPVEIKDMTSKALYAALANRLKGKKDIRPRVRDKQVYLEIVKTK